MEERKVSRYEVVRDACRLIKDVDLPLKHIPVYC